MTSNNNRFWEGQGQSSLESVRTLTSRTEHRRKPSQRTKDTVENWVNENRFCWDACHRINGDLEVIFAHFWRPEQQQESLTLPWSDQKQSLSNFWNLFDKYQLEQEAKANNGQSCNSVKWCELKWPIPMQTLQFAPMCVLKIYVTGKASLLVNWITSSFFQPNRHLWKHLWLQLFAIISQAF